MNVRRIRASASGRESGNARAMAEDDGPLGVHDNLRSDDVEYISIVMQEHVAYKVVGKLGRLGAVQFTDLNEDLTLFQRRYVREVNRMEALERKLKFLEEKVAEHGCDDRRHKPDVEQFLNHLETKLEDNRGGGEMERFERMVDAKDSEMKDLLRFRSNLSDELMVQEELRAVLDYAKRLTYSEDGMGGAVNAGGNAADVESAGARTGGGTYLRFVAGVVDLKHKRQFERQIFVATRGNCLMSFDPEAASQADSRIKDKVPFIFYFSTAIIHEKIQKICRIFSANLYEIPDVNQFGAIEERSAEVYREIQERESVLNKNEQDILLLLDQAASFMDRWKWAVTREKAIYHTMNHFSSDVSGVLHAEGWVRCDKKEQVKDLVENSAVNGGGDGGGALGQVSDVPRDQWPSVPPTFFKTNKFTKVFQVIVDTYGVPRYHEINPALLTVISFPFSFGIMFGDIGHGLIVLSFALWTVWNEAWLQREFGGKDEIFDIIFAGRYMIVLMGFFAFYCGWMYNDWFAMGLRIWPTHWFEVPPTKEGATKTGMYPFDDVPIYPWGIDPVWHRASNDLQFFNSVKMKMAVCFGVTQMLVGLSHRAQNAIYFNKPGRLNLDLWFEAIPMIVFMSALFGYMCYMILYKWSVQWVWDGCDTNFKAPGCERNNCCNPPQLISTLINMALNPGTVKVEEELYPGQATVQVALLLIAVIMVPLMLIPKPYFEIQRLKEEHGHTDHQLVARASEADTLVPRDADVSLAVGHGAGGEEEEEEEAHGSGEIIIHQLIETIEFTLGCISNTASYLRLWALSLAHSQLSGVFLDKAFIGPTLAAQGNPVLGAIVCFLAYGAFAAITFAVLICMDNLECFLHALRLSWVEYQNKFYRGDGIAFTPLSIQSLLQGGGA